MSELVGKLSQGVEYYKGDPGPKGDTGPRGEKGEPFRFEDFTPEQLESLKVKGDTGPAGEPGVKGDKGDAFTYADFTQEQLEALRGPQGQAGRDGLNGKDGKDGLDGKDGKDGKNYSVEVVESITTTLEIQPNKFYKFGEVTELNLTLSEITDTTQLNEYMFEFVSGATATTLTLPDTIKWLETPTIESNKFYQCSIVDNIGVLLGVSNV